MSYTVWMHDQQIGETDFEIAPLGTRRGGVFRPTQFGVSVLPAITRMFPALLELHAFCRRRGIDPDDESLEPGHPDLEMVSATPAGQRVIEAAKYIANVELRDRVGRVLQWEALMISDADEIADAVARCAPEDCAEPPLPARPLRYFISATILPVKERKAPWMSVPYRAPTC